MSDLRQLSDHEFFTWTGRQRAARAAKHSTGQGYPMGTRAITDIETAGDIRELGDREFFCHWSELRRRIALGGKPVSLDLVHRYKAASEEYRRRVARAS